jgi:TonB family protein
MVEQPASADLTAHLALWFPLYSDKMVYAMDIETIGSDWAGRVIDGRFSLLQWLGGSERGGVFLTELQEHQSQKAAIKLIPADTAEAEAHLAGWAATATLSHPHLMRLFYSGRCQIGATPLVYAVTEYAEENLSQILPDRPLTPTEAKEMLGPVLDALAYLHGRGLVHGHLKPSNILVVDDRLKLSSDSVQVIGESGKHIPAPGVYDAPECATGTISPAADVWSLGVTLVEALTQHPPIWNRSTQSEPIVQASIPEPLAGIARECLRFDPQHRCTIGDAKARLEPAGALPKTAGKTSGTAPARLRVPAFVAAGLVLLAVIAVLLLRSHWAQSAQPAGEQQPESANSSLPPEAQSDKGAAGRGAVAERVLPDVLPTATASIRGQVNVKIRVAVDPDGGVSNATIDSPGPSKYFAKVALQAAQQWKFKPAQAGGRVISSAWVLEFQFTQAGTEVTPVEVAP